MLAAVLTDSILRQQGAERTAWGNLIHSRLEKKRITHRSCRFIRPVIPLRDNTPHSFLSFFSTSPSVCTHLKCFLTGSGNLIGLYCFIFSPALEFRAHTKEAKWVWDPKSDKKRKILKKKERLIEKQWATRIVDNPRKVFERRINDRYLCSGSLSFTKQTDFGSRGTLTRLKLLEQAALGNIFLFFLVLHRVGKQQDPPCKFHSRD